MLTDEQYQEEILRILQEFPIRFKGEGPTQLTDFIFIGNYIDASNISRLKELGITHVLNCAPYSSTGKSPYAKEEGMSINYKEINAEDDRDYNILQHFEESKNFLDDAKRCKGRALVHCAMGINRSAAICAAYIMTDAKMTLVETIRLMKDKRGKLLSNRGFQIQLILFAKNRGLLAKEQQSSFLDTLTKLLS